MVAQAAQHESSDYSVDAQSDSMEWAEDAFKQGQELGPDAGIEALGFQSFLSQFYNLAHNVKLEVASERIQSTTPDEVLREIDPTKIEDLEWLIEEYGEINFLAQWKLKANRTIGQLLNLIDNIAPLLPIKRQTVSAEISQLKNKHEILSLLFPEYAWKTIGTALESFFLSGKKLATIISIKLVKRT